MNPEQNDSLKARLLVLIDGASTGEIDLAAFAEAFGKFSYLELARLKEDGDYETLKELKSHAGYFHRKWGHGNATGSNCTASCCPSEDDTRADFHRTITAARASIVS